MYEVGNWFIYLMDAAILAIVAFIVLVAIFVKRGQYTKDSVSKIRAEIQLATGWSEYYVVPCLDNDKSVGIENFIYMLDPDKRRYGKYPMNPFMGLSWLQVPIRIETWAKDNPEPIKPTYDKAIATSAEIRAMLDEHTATTTAMEIQEMHAQQKVIVDAIANQPNKNAVYVMLGVCILVNGGTLFYIVQLVQYLVR